MKKAGIWIALLLTGLLVVLAGCGAPAGDASSDGGSASLPEEPSAPAIGPADPTPQPEPEPEPEPEPDPEPPFRNPLTGEGSETDLSTQRPVAVMINNLKAALPQCGVSQADIIYEVPAEGGITRMLAVFQSVEGVGNIGTVRSARTYYVELADGLDAVYLHAGGSPGAYQAIREWGISALDCVNGPYEGSLFWRDRDRWKSAGMEHSVFTSGEKILELFPTYSRLRQEHPEGYSLPLTFARDAAPEGETAGTVTVRYSSYKTGVFTYDPDRGKYLAEQYGQPYTDGNTGEQVAVTNVLVLFTDISRIPGDDAGRLDVRLTGTGRGYFICGGTYMEITWSKTSHAEPLLFFTPDGEALALGIGSSYINIVDESYPVTIE